MVSRPIITQVANLPALNLHYYERYLPTAFDESMTILQKMNKVINHLNDIGEISNNLVTQWNELMEWIVGNGLTEIVSEEIDKRILDGTFDTLIYNIVGSLELLETVDKTNMVTAINEVNQIATENDVEIGDISLLNTDDKSNLVNAINEMLTQVLINKQSPISIGEATGYGTISGLKVRQQSVLAMAVEIGNNTETNIVHLPNGVRYTLNSIALPVNPSHATLDRKDIIFVNGEGVISYLNGETSLNPIAPTLPTNSVLLAEINVKATDTTINDADIIDKRELKSLTQLLTNNKSNLVQAINEIIVSLNDVINNAVGDVANLPTTDKTTVVNSIIEVYNNLTDLINDTGDLDLLPTTDKTTIVNSIIESYNLLSDLINNVGDLALLPTTDKTTIVNSIIELFNSLSQTINNELGDVANLPTTDKTTIVNSIIEIFNDLTDTKTDLGNLTTNVGNITTLPTLDKSTIVNSLIEVHQQLSDVMNDVDGLVFNVRSFGAIGNGIADDALAIQNAMDEAKVNGGLVFFPSGVYRITQTINVDFTQKTDSNVKGITVMGSGSSNTQILVGADITAFSIVGGATGSSMHMQLNFGGMHITTGSFNNVIGIDIKLCAFGNLYDLFLNGMSTAIVAEDVLSSRFDNVRVRWSDRGVLLKNVNQFSRANSINFDRCHFGICAEYGVKIDEGCSVNFFGGSIEGCGVDGIGAERFGIQIQNAGFNGATGLNLYGVYFENNGGLADVHIRQGINPCNYLISGCNFNKATTGIAPFNIRFDQDETDAEGKLTVESCSFRSMNDYVPNASNQVIKFYATGIHTFDEIGNLYHNQIEKPSVTGGSIYSRVRFNGTLATPVPTMGYNIKTIVKDSVGKYTITFNSPSRSSAKMLFVSVNGRGEGYLFAETATTLTIETRDSAGVLADFSAISIVVYD